jgi:putative nucleotidyltransferase with HDIG domain
MIAATMPGVFQKASGIDIARTGIITLLLSTVTTFYIRLSDGDILRKKYSKTTIILCNLGSILFIMMIPDAATFSIWMVGGLIISMLLDNKLGLLLHFNLTFILGVTLVLRPEELIHLLIIGVLLNLLAGALKQKSTVIYATIIILSTNITIGFAINNFVFETNHNVNYLNSLFSILTVIISAFFISFLYDRRKENEIEKPADSDLNQQYLPKTEMSQGAQELSIASVPDMNTFEGTKEGNPAVGLPDLIVDLGSKTSYEILCDTNNELLQKMKQYSEVLYEHCIRIGDLSGRAAKVIQANEMLARAGGYYHEVGKMQDNNYIEAGLKIADEYAFPKELKAILKEHNIKHEKPNSVEAVIVMLSDNVVSTIEYIKKTEDHKYTTNKIIDNIFQMRMEKGTFDTSNLSLKDFKALKEFFQKEFN